MCEAKTGCRIFEAFSSVYTYILQVVFEWREETFTKRDRPTEVQGGILAFVCTSNYSQAYLDMRHVQDARILTRSSRTLTRARYGQDKQV
jgi:hypothetical protein